MRQYLEIPPSGQIDSVSLKRDTFGQIKSATYIVREKSHPNVRGISYVVKGCRTCGTTDTVQPIMLFMKDPASIWEGYYCVGCGRFYWIRPMRASRLTVGEVRYLLKREGWRISSDGEKYIAERDYSENSAINKDRARQSRYQHGDYRPYRKDAIVLQSRSSVVAGMETGRAIDRK